MGIDLFEEKLNNDTKTVLLEDSRTQLLNKSKRVPKGNQRYKRRIKSKVASNVRQFNSVDMNKLFKENILTVNIAVRGETDNYIVKIKFGGFLDLLHKELKEILDICDKFDINEKWLRDGDGPKKREKTEFDELAYMMGALFAEDNQFKVKIIKAMLSLEDEDWYFIEKLINKFTK